MPGMKKGFKKLLGKDGAGTYTRSCARLISQQASISRVFLPLNSKSMNRPFPCPSHCDMLSSKIFCLLWQNPIPISTKAIQYRTAGLNPPSLSSTASSSSTALSLPASASATLQTPTTLEILAPKTRILLHKSPPDGTAQQMPFTILTHLMTSFATAIFEESRIYGVDYALYRDPVHTYDVLTISVERVSGGGGGGKSGSGETTKGALAEEKLTYADCMLLGNGVREFLGRVDDETVEVELYRRRGKGEGTERDVLVGRGSVGFSAQAMKDGVAGGKSNTTDVRW